MEGKAAFQQDNFIIGKEWKDCKKIEREGKNAPELV